MVRHRRSVEKPQKRGGNSHNHESQFQVKTNSEKQAARGEIGESRACWPAQLVLLTSYYVFTAVRRVLSPCIREEGPANTRIIYIFAVI